MTATATTEIRDVLGAGFARCDSPSLRLEKFVVIEDKERKKTEIERLCKCANSHARVPPFRLSSLPSALSMPMKLQSRLILNQSGGVIENAGLCLHRHFGCPMIPGSAVKGIARHVAIQAIQGAGSATAKTDLLVRAALVFGWCEQEWRSDQRTKQDTFVSDFRYACDGEGWQEAWTAAAERLLAVLRVPETRVDRKNPLWESLPNVAGLVSFLPAFPTLGSTPKLVPDLVNCHHPRYYQGKQMKATDDENPIPNFFPAVDAGLTFEFVVAPLCRALHGLPADLAATRLAGIAMEWLKTGLTTHGVGAKTVAGYGWFAEPGAPPIAASAPASAEQQADAIVAEMRKLLPNTSNFRVALPRLAALKDAAVLRRIFDEAIPEASRRKLRKSDPYWQSFTGRPEGKAFLDQLGIALK